MHIRSVKNVLHSCRRSGRSAYNRILHLSHTLSSNAFAAYSYLDVESSQKRVHVKYILVAANFHQTDDSSSRLFPGHLNLINSPLRQHRYLSLGVCWMLLCNISLLLDAAWITAVNARLGDYVWSMFSMVAHAATSRRNVAFTWWLCETASTTYGSRSSIPAVRCDRGISEYVTSTHPSRKFVASKQRAWR